MALKQGIAEAFLALKDFANIDKNSDSNTVSVFSNEGIPITIGAENVSNRCSGDNFHRP